MTKYHVAQCNIARLRAPIDSPDLAEFVAALAPINELADDAPGFVWRLQTDAGDSTAIRVLDDEMLIVNMSVWETIDDLAKFAYNSEHRDVMRRRREWFERLADAYLVLWWVEAGIIPTVADAQTRLEQLRRTGPSAEAFTFRSPFPAPGDSVGSIPVADDWLCPI